MLKLGRCTESVVGDFECELVLRDQMDGAELLHLSRRGQRSADAVLQKNWTICTERKNLEIEVTSSTSLQEAFERDLPGEAVEEVIIEQA